MNRGVALWVSLAVLLALFVTGSVVAMFPLSESRLVQPPSIPLQLPLSSRAAAPIKFPASVVGKTTHASLGRGGQAASQTPASAEAGQVSVRFQRTARPTRSRTSTSAPTKSTTSPRTAKRPTTIGGVSSGSHHDDAGLAVAGRKTQARPPR